MKRFIVYPIGDGYVPYNYCALPEVELKNMAHPGYAKIFKFLTISSTYAMISNFNFLILEFQEITYFFSLKYAIFPTLNRSRTCGNKRIHQINIETIL